MRAPSYAGSDATRKNFLYNFKAGLRAAALIPAGELLLHCDRPADYR